MLQYYLWCIRRRKILSTSFAFCPNVFSLTFGRIFFLDVEFQVLPFNFKGTSLVFSLPFFLVENQLFSFQLLHGCDLFFSCDHLGDFCFVVIPKYPQGIGSRTTTLPRGYRNLGMFKSLNKMMQTAYRWPSISMNAELWTLCLVFNRLIMMSQVRSSSK